MNKELEIVCNILNEKIASDVTIIDFDKHNPICDYFVLWFIVCIDCTYCRCK